MTTNASETGTNNSITNVAALAHVSTATVSRVLTGRRTKDDDISRRVKKAAEQLNYSVNYAASALRSDKTNTIGLVLPDPITPLISRLLSFLEPAAGEIGKQLLVTLGSDGQTQRNRVETLVSRRVDGIIVVPTQGADLRTVLEQYVKNVPIVQVYGHSSSFHINWVGVDETAAMQLVISHLAEYNATSMAYFSESVDSNSAADLFITFQSSTNLLNILTQPNWTTFGENTVRRGYDDAMRLFNTTDTKPNAVICASDAIAVGVEMALNRLGIQIPEEVKVMGFGDYPEAQIVMPTLSSMRPPTSLIASEALRLISIENSEKRWLPAHIAFPPRLIQRESTSAARMGSSDMTTPEDR